MIHKPTPEQNEIAARLTKAAAEYMATIDPTPDSVQIISNGLRVTINAWSLKEDLPTIFPHNDPLPKDVGP